jgi:hypothetical protein
MTCGVQYTCRVARTSHHAAWHAPHGMAAGSAQAESRIMLKAMREMAGKSKDEVGRPALWAPPGAPQQQSKARRANPPAGGCK